MVDVKFEAVPEFNKELKKLSKRYKLLNEDFEKFRTVSTKKLPDHTPGTFEISGLGANVKVPIYKVKHFRSRDFRGRGSRSGFRIIYTHIQHSNIIIFIEIYHRGNKSNHDIGRIKKYFEEV